MYSQVLKLLDKEKTLKISRKTKGSETYVKRFDGYQHLVVMLFGILKHFDSLRKLEIGMKAEAHKLRHLGLDYLVRHSTLAEANIRRPQEFFASVYAHLLEKYASFLADSRPPRSYKGQPHEPKDWEKVLYMMDSTTITLFDNILKGVGRHPKSGKKKGGMKVHTVMRYHVGVPMVVQLTSAAKHDHYLLKEVHLPKDSTLAMDRGYIVWKFVNQFTKFNHFELHTIANYKGELYNLPFNMNTFHQMWGVCTPEETEEKIKDERQKAKELLKFTRRRQRQ